MPSSSPAAASMLPDLLNASARIGSVNLVILVSNSPPVKGITEFIKLELIKIVKHIKILTIQ